MKTAMLLPVLVILAAIAATPGSAQEAKAGDGEEVSATDDPNKASTATTDRKKDAEPATRFTPSEKIRADDALSFPVDI